MTLVYRLVIAAAMVVSGGVHAYLYLHGYGHIPTVGTGFLVQASVFCAVGVLLAVGAPRWFGWASGLLSAGALAAFGLSRTVGLFGFVETAGNQRLTHSSALSSKLWRCWRSPPGWRRCRGSDQTQAPERIRSRPTALRDWASSATSSHMTVS
ncbi:hypothetical protein BZL30_3347 [Mycobacterium kansasii]|uniref:Uncharacterized protein n=1 Tax=Mycobacterium kansasii TaxID=1768 RepID=A0A1V3X8N6_MYCKA|nr:hypothetical protein BZL30_3347 [Mycobacterium kansasii]